MLHDIVWAMIDGRITSVCGSMPSWGWCCLVTGSDPGLLVVCPPIARTSSVVDRKWLLEIVRGTTLKNRVQGQ